MSPAPSRDTISRLGWLRTACSRIPRMVSGTSIMSPGRVVTVPYLEAPPKMSHTAARPSLRVERDGHVAHLILTGPGKGNAMGPYTWTDIPAALDELEADPSVHALVVSGSGEHFSYGLDIAASAATFGDGDANARRELLADIEKMQRAFTRIAESRLPAIAAVSGWCIGSGVELACACDIRYAHAGAKFSLREVQLAI